MTELIFATNNAHKASEIQAAIGSIIGIITLKEAGIDIDIPEPHNTLEANASEKSTTIYTLTGRDCFSEDTGLEVYSLNGEPGVRSARYADDDGRFNTNIEKLLFNMVNIENRNARFRTVVSLRLRKKEFLFEGICEGRIGRQPVGTGGFGYDAVFLPTGSNKTFAEMTMGEKASFSHRKKASDKMVVFLQRRLTVNTQLI
jgi:XTP/dITP diphosphohydrolase